MADLRATERSGSSDSYLLAEDECEKNLLTPKWAENHHRSLTRAKVVWQRLSLPLWISSICLWLTFLPLIISRSTVVSNQDKDRPSENDLSWSPAFEALRLSDETFNNGFFVKSIYRGQPNASLEDAWRKLYNRGYVPIPSDKLDVLNKSTAIDWWRTTSGDIVASLEVYHDLHCLDFIRQYTYRDEYDYSEELTFDGTPRMIREHVDHCINSLRIKLMCSADITPYLFIRNPAGALLPYRPDFNSKHRCRDFDRIDEWYVSHTLSDEELGT